MITISYSGGRGSAATVLLAEKLGLDYEWVFADTLIEDEDLYRFNEDLQKVVSRRMVRLCDGRTPWDVFYDEKYIGDTRSAPCSKILKTKVVRDHMRENGRGQLVLGMGLGELDRVEKAVRNWAPVTVSSLLVDYEVDQAGVDGLIAEAGLRAPRLYDYGFPHNNCGGFCVRAGLKQFSSLMEFFPDRYAHHEKEEQRVSAHIESRGRRAFPFLTYVEKRQKHRMTLTEFRERRAAGKFGHISPYDYGGCGCFTDTEDEP